MIAYANPNTIDPLDYSLVTSPLTMDLHRPFMIRGAQMGLASRWSLIQALTLYHKL